LKGQEMGGLAVILKGGEKVSNRTKRMTFARKQ
jgi:hypothetical protein